MTPQNPVIKQPDRDKVSMTLNNPVIDYMDRYKVGTAGAMLPVEAGLLYSMLVAVNPSAALTVVELGCQWGYSSLYIAQALCDREVVGGRLHTCDVHEGAITRTRQRLQEAGLESFVELYHKPSTDMEVDNIDVLVIDANHTFEDVNAELLHFRTRFSESAFVFLHDAAHPGIARAVRVFVQTARPVGKKVEAIFLPSQFGIGILHVYDLDSQQKSFV